MKFCINCIHYRPAVQHSSPEDQSKYARCARSVPPPSIDLVTGATVTEEGDYCTVQRYTERATACGKEGGFWEPRAASISIDVAARDARHPYQESR